MRFTFRCVDPAADAPLLHSWVTRPYAAFWGMLAAGVDDIEKEYAAIQASGHHHALLGLDGGVPAFLVEEYLPASSPLATAYPVRPGDAGMHLLVAPPSNAPVAGFTTAVMDAVLARLFAKPGVDRIVVEPDVRNTRVHALNERLGFRPRGVVALPDKDALLSFCSREDYLAARALNPFTAPNPPARYSDSNGAPL
ncbi:GNAT family N-acetyltransferase [Pseudarthrobacter sp. NPDC058196]|uniref:GNAT family N-acetyltransferase n=1 Tax=Pseudarthrobacter sp. NPDC058196 TaxID=3346376 RepID=UPI0036D78286